jgi:dTDP-4-amino-4,6-dideoxygalactose transaminase
VPGIRCKDVGEHVANYSYFPIFVTAPNSFLQSNFKSRDALYEQLRANGIFARRYFYPLISDFPMYRKNTSEAQENFPVARRISNEVICLPIHPNLLDEEVDFIVKVIADFND